MAADSVISVEGLGKKYIIRHQIRHDTLRDTLAHGARETMRRLVWGEPGPSSEEFWALRDVAFEVGRGEVVGIIGRNGAGKSTLLKILSQITEPTTGRVKVTGRIASLLEVGTGFHPELSGRENVFLNGAILGMRRSEIARKFDEIVAFAEVDKFIDTPVKRYSSGMQVRLAFAVAAHLEPDILIVDEVLAVGDIEFQKKCIGRIQLTASSESRTVLFVSHNLQIVRRLCTKGILLQNGSVETMGESGPVLDAYCAGLGDADAAIDFAPPPDMLGRCYVTGASVRTKAGAPVQVVAVGEPWEIVVRYRLARAYEAFVVAVGIQSADGAAVQTAWSQPSTLAAGEYQAVFEQDVVALEAGHYTILVGLSANNRSLQQIEACRLDIVAEGAQGYFPAVAGVGFVLQSMKSRQTRLS